MTATPEEFRQASDPATPGQTLADLAHRHPDLRAAIAANPATYAGLHEWLRAHPGAGAPVSTELAVTAPGNVAPWREPNRDAVLTWGGYDLRYGVALALLVLAAVAQAVPAVGTLIGLVLAGAGFAVLPAPLPSRARALVAIGIGILVALIGLILTASGASTGFTAMLIASLLAPVAALSGWIVARERPARSFLALLVLLLGIAGIFLGLSSHPFLMVAVVIALVAGGAWIARGIHIASLRPAPERAPSQVVELPGAAPGSTVVYVIAAQRRGTPAFVLGVLLLLLGVASLFVSWPASGQACPTPMWYLTVDPYTREVFSTFYSSCGITISYQITVAIGLAVAGVVAAAVGAVVRATKSARVTA